ncbi:MAG: hypothetical protein D6775_01755 [Caldilineae bacterium]|nr:MAG: hypothetical protein D6775_01755 [Caldilineae bacterium]
MSNIAMFAGLVIDEEGRPVEVTWVGNDACYVVLDDDFRRHVDAEEVDRQVLRFFKEQIDQHRDLAVRGVLELMGKDDIFTKTALEYSIRHLDADEALGHPMPEQAKQLLHALGFRIVLNSHGEVVEVRMPEGDIDPDDLRGLGGL